MVLSIWSKIGEKLTEWADAVKNFFIENSRSPILWVVIILIGLVIFEYVYKKLSKD